MRVASFASNFRAHHAVAAIFEKADVFAFVRLRETRPAAVRIELCIRREKFGTARTAHVHPVVAYLKQVARKGTFGSGFAEHLIALGPQFFPPLLFRFNDFGRRRFMIHHIR